MNKISVITICFNNLSELQKTCQSVDNQSIHPYEHIIIDGSTNADIKSFFEKNNNPSYRKSIHEKDHGISDAFNKGIQLAKGDIIVLLNASDTYYDETSLSKVIQTFNEYPNINWLHAKYQLFRGGKWVIIGKPFDAGKLYRGMRSICHQTMYIRKKLYEKHGLYDTSLKIGMDYDFLIRIKDEPFFFIDEPIVNYAPAGISSVQYLQALQETSIIFQKKFGNTLLHRLWQVRLKFLYFLLKSPFGQFLYRIKIWLKLENM